MCNDLPLPIIERIIISNILMSSQLLSFTIRMVIKSATFSSCYNHQVCGSRQFDGLVLYDGFPCCMEMVIGEEAHAWGELWCQVFY